MEYLWESTQGELAAAPVVEAQYAGSRRVDVSAILGMRRRSDEDENEEEPPAPAMRHVPSRSRLYQEDLRRRFLRNSQ